MIVLRRTALLVIVLSFVSGVSYGNDSLDFGADYIERGLDSEEDGDGLSGEIPEVVDDVPAPKAKVKKHKKKGKKRKAWKRNKKKKSKKNK